MRTFLIIFALLPLGSCFGGTCPCGADPADPFSAHDWTFAGSHDLENECVCRCGDGSAFAVTRDRACSDFERECVNRDGTEAWLSCD